jgi:transcriptional regulator of arginine metabolism
MRELRLVKVPGADGVGVYSSPEEWDTTPSLESLLPALFHSADGVDHLLVVRTMKGGAQTVAAAIDWEEWPEVLGTLAGDDTILLILRDPGALPEVRVRLEAMAAHR